MEQKIYTEQEALERTGKALEAYMSIYTKGAIEGGCAVLAGVILGQIIYGVGNLIAEKIEAARMKKLAKKINEKT